MFQVFRIYNDLPVEDRPKRREEKIDMWHTIFSRTVKYNLAPLFEFWGVPLSEEACAMTSSLPAYFPDDDITRQYGDRMAEILEKYSDVVRVPEQVEVFEFPVDEGVRQDSCVTLDPSLTRHRMRDEL